jgi:hypothetical protein
MTAVLTPSGRSSTDTQRPTATATTIAIRLIVAASTEKAIVRVTRPS